MECNKDEAIKAKVIAEQMLTEKDFAGAKKFAIKAQALYPRTEGLIQLMMTINIYISAEKKVRSNIGGLEVDRYGVLGVTPTADDETIRKQYRKLALMIHPDKNKCVGADGAFKLVLEAWSLLSDKAKRYAYDQRRVCFPNKNASSSSSNGFRFKKPVNFKTISPHVISSDPMYIIKWNLAARLTNEWEKANEEIKKREASVCGTKKRMARNKKAPPGPPPDYDDPMAWFVIRLTRVPPEVSAAIADEERVKRAQEAKETGTKKRKANNKERENDTFNYWTKYQKKRKYWSTPSPSGEPVFWYI